MSPPRSALAGRVAVLRTDGTTIHGRVHGAGNWLAVEVDRHRTVYIPHAAIVRITPPRGRGPRP